MPSNPPYILVKKGSFWKWSIETPACKIFNFLFFFSKITPACKIFNFFQRFFPKISPISRWRRFLVPPKCLCSPLVILFCSFQVDVIIHIPTDIFFLFCTWDSEKKSCSLVRLSEGMGSELSKSESNVFRNTLVMSKSHFIQKVP